MNKEELRKLRKLAGIEKVPFFVKFMKRMKRMKRIGDWIYIWFVVMPIIVFKSITGQNIK